MTSSLIGAPVPRREDRRLLTGAGRYTADLDLPDQRHAAFVRSPYAHAEVVAIDTVDASNSPGVAAVLTGRDYAADGLSGLVHPVNLPDHLDPAAPTFAEQELFPPPPASPIVTDRVRHVGEIVAVVVADSAPAALDAAERVVVDYRPLPAVIEPDVALSDGAPTLFPSGNLCLDASRGDEEAAADAIERAAHLVRATVNSHRVHGCPIEPRSALARFDDGRYTLWAPSQGVHRFRRSLATALAVDTTSVRVITPEVGGAFGLRIPCANEYPLLLWAARTCGRPVRWEGSRSESFLADVHGRDTRCDGTLALDGDGRIMAIRLDYVGNLGAHPLSLAVLANVTRMAGPAYRVPVMAVRVRGVLTNTTPTSVYRGAGRPEVTHVVERLMDLGADAVGVDRAEMRRRNLIRPSELPYRTPLGLSYHDGEFSANFEEALEIIDWHGFEQRRADARRRGRLAGIGIANYLESPAAAGYERTDVTVRSDGAIEASIGTQASGQGHETSFAQVVAATLGVPLDTVSITFGDSDLVAGGSGTHADRSMRLGGTILVRACEELVRLGGQRASAILGVSEDAVDYASGVFFTDGDVAAGAVGSVALRDVVGDQPLTATSEISTRLHAHPNGVAAGEVEIDPETGALTVTRYVSVDDVGRAVNPMIVEGQLHGATAQGIGEALLEQVLYDPSTGQLRTGSFLDYGLPSTVETPSLDGRIKEVPTASNPLGVKGGGEAGVTPAAAVIVSAAVDALRSFGVRHLDTPLSPERLWRAMANGDPARRRSSPHGPSAVRRDR